MSVQLRLIARVERRGHGLPIDQYNDLGGFEAWDADKEFDRLLDDGLGRDQRRALLEGFDQGLSVSFGSGL